MAVDKPDLTSYRIDRLILLLSYSKHAFPANPGVPHHNRLPACPPKAPRSVPSRPVIRHWQCMLDSRLTSFPATQNTYCAFYRPRRSRSRRTTWLRTKMPSVCGRGRRHWVRATAAIIAVSKFSVSDGKCVRGSQTSNSYREYSSGAGTQVCVNLSIGPHAIERW